MEQGAGSPHAIFRSIAFVFSCGTLRKERGCSHVHTLDFFVSRSITTTV